MKNGNENAVRHPFSTQIQMWGCSRILHSTVPYCWNAMLRLNKYSLEFRDKKLEHRVHVHSNDTPTVQADHRKQFSF